MTLMNCKRAEKLMPLYAAGDLPAGGASRAVAAHVARCASCAGLAAEFRASLGWAREAGAVPEFGEEFYERLRAGVLDRVGRDTRPAAPSRFAPRFGAMFASRRLACAASLALAACALALAFYVSRGAGEPRKNLTAGAAPANEPGRHATPELPPRPTPQAVRAQERQENPRQSRRAATPGNKRPPRPAGDVTGGGYKRTPTLRHAAPTSDPAAARVLTAAADNSGRQPAATAAARAETASVSRIEIQTADPSIRIIWLAPGGGGEAGPDGVDPNR